MLLRVHTHYVLALALLALFALTGARRATATLDNSQGDYTAYLPLVVQGSTATSTPTPPATGGGNNAGAFWLPFTTADNTYVGTGRTNISVDGAGGVHLTYMDVLGLDNGQRPAYYAYCPSGCADPAHWTRISLGSDVFDIRLQLDQQGRPRAMIYAYVYHNGEDNGALKQYQYATCNAGCTNANNWTITPITDAIMYDAKRPDQPFHYFALDTEGHPGFVYNDLTDHDNHGGTFYAFCHSDTCGDAGNWQEIQLTNDLLWQPELAYAPDGQPRIVAQGINPDQQFNKLVYLECSDDCATMYGTWFTEAGSFTSYRLRLNSAGQPRIALYTGMVSGPLEASQLYYLACDANCTSANADGWQAVNLHSQNRTPMTVDLALDRQERPRIVYKQGDVGPGYAWCDANCMEESGTWKAVLAESNEPLQQANPLSTTACSQASWTSGHLPALALDPAGNPRISFDTRFQLGGIDMRPGHSGQLCDITTVVPLARFLIP